MRSWSCVGFKAAGSDIVRQSRELLGQEGDSIMNSSDLEKTLLRSNTYDIYERSILSARALGACRQAGILRSSQDTGKLDILRVA